MTLIPILGSSRIRAYAWEAGRRPVNEDGQVLRGGRLGTLQLEFTDGARWYYFNVPEQVFEGWLMSRSKGSFFGQHIQRSYRSAPAEEVERQQTGA